MATCQDYPEEVVSDDYGRHLLERLAEFRRDGLFCDFTLTVENQSFKVHRSVLAGCSDYFRAMFSHGMVESSKDSLCLQSVPKAGLQPLLDFAYSGKLGLTLKTIPDILSVATFLQITSAISLCCKFLVSKMTFENAATLVEMGESYGLKEIKDFHRRMVLDKFMDYAETEEFLKLDGGSLSSYLMEDSLRTTTESRLLQCALKWYQHDPEGREPVAHEVMDKIRYTIDGWPAIEYALQQEPFKSNRKCRDIIRSSQHYMHKASRKHLNQSYRTRVRYEKKTLVQIGGLKKARTALSALDFEMPGDELAFDEEEERCGTGRNNYWHTSLKQWFPLGVIGHMDSRSHNPVVEVNDFGIMVGGYLYTSDFVRTFQHASNEVKLFVPGGFALWDMPYMAEPRAHHVAVHAPGYVYAVGGKNDSGPLRSVERFHLEEETWSFVNSMDQPIVDHAGAAFGDWVYITGGTVNDTIVNTTWCYYPREDDWLPKAPMLVARCSHTMALVNNCLIVCGGRTAKDSSRCLSSVEALSLEVGQWTFLTPMRYDCAFMTPVVLDSKLLIVGGENSVGDLMDQVQQYDASKDSWSCYCTLTDPMRNAGCCAVTIKLTPDGEEDVDSIAEAYDRNSFLDTDEDDDDDDYLSPFKSQEENKLWMLMCKV